MEGLETNTSARTVMRGEEEISLTRKEYDLLLFFVRNLGIVLYKSSVFG